MSEPFPADPGDWIELFPSLLAVCSDGPLFAVDPIAESDVTAAPGSLPKAIPLRARAVSMMARELTARLWCSRFNYNRPRRFRDGSAIQVSNHFAFRDIGVTPGRDVDPTESWRHSALIQGGERVARMYLDHGPPGALRYGISVARMDESGDVPVRAGPRDGAIYAAVMAEVIPYAQALVDHVESEMGESEFAAAREPWLTQLQLRNPGIWGSGDS